MKIKKNYARLNDILAMVTFSIPLIFNLQANGIKLNTNTSTLIEEELSFFQQDSFFDFRDLENLLSEKNQTSRFNNYQSNQETFDSFLVFSSSIWGDKNSEREMNIALLPQVEASEIWEDLYSYEIDSPNLKITQQRVNSHGTNRDISLGEMFDNIVNSLNNLQIAGNSRKSISQENELIFVNDLNHRFDHNLNPRLIPPISLTNFHQNQFPKQELFNSPGIGNLSSLVSQSYATKIDSNFFNLISLVDFGEKQDYNIHSILSHQKSFILTEGNQNDANINSVSYLQKSSYDTEESKMLTSIQEQIREQLEERKEQQEKMQQKIREKVEKQTEKQQKKQKKGQERQEKERQKRFEQMKQRQENLAQKLIQK